MRATGAEHVSEAERVILKFEGREIEARRGETIAAALTAAGVLSLRETRSGTERGIFCGMGVCQDCRIVVDGQHGVRACMTRIVKPLVLSKQPARVPVTAIGAPARRPRTASALTPELLVIGGGAAGLAAATAAARAGAEVLLADERPAPGGQFYKQLISNPDLPPESFADRQMRRGTDRIQRANEAGATFLPGAEVVAAFQPMRLLLATDEGMRTVTPRRLIVATGAYERGQSVPGWTLPGVMTTGAFQTLLRSYRVLAGRRVLFAGNGPLNLQVSIEAARAGADVLAVAELAPLRGGGTMRALAKMLAGSPALTATGIAMRAELALRRIPLLTGVSLSQVVPCHGGLAVELAAAEGRPVAHFVTDIVTMGYGFLPSNEVMRLLGCRFESDKRWDTLVPVRDDDFMTSVDGLYAVGDCAQFGGAQAAEIEGTIAGAIAARSLGHANGEFPSARLRRKLARHRGFQQGLWQLYAASGSRPETRAPDTIVCRCEEIVSAELIQAVNDGAAVIGSIKRRTRSGMGPCQGRYCAGAGKAALYADGPSATGENGYWAPRPPIKPTTIADLIAGLSRHGD